MKIKDVIRLEGWVTLPEAARLLETSPQAVHKMVFEQNLFKTIRRVSDKPLYVVALWEVEDVGKKRQAARMSAEALMDP